MNTFTQVKRKLMKVVHASALSLQKTGKIIKKTKFFLRASFRYKKRNLKRRNVLRYKKLFGKQNLQA